MSRIPIASIFFASVLLGGTSLAYEGGAPSNVAGAPGQGTCLGCHSGFALNSGPAGFSIAAPSTTVGLSSLAVQTLFTGSGAPQRGFEITMRSGAGAFAGTWQITNATTTHLANSSHVTHTSAGTLATSWSMTWAPPVTLAAGPLKFYAAGLEANGNGSSSGDHVYSTSSTVYQARLATPTATWPMGTIQTLTLDAPTRSGDDYVVALSHSATPTPLGGAMILPVDATSPLFSLVWNAPAMFPGFLGTLDGTGHAQAQVILPPLPGLSGFPLHFAYATFQPGTITVSEVSNRVAVTLQ
ncbi:MAG TPA: choice-of-anchor V domain-containing protein [Planctomycetota bacterium]|jgi:hypothetical protein|nr:choice-of-anchor V domain-containing protein [Planctomycetota bacterium]